MTTMQFRTNIATLCGINAAVTAEILWEQLNEQMADRTTEEHYGYAKEISSAKTASITVNSIARTGTRSLNTAFD